MALAQTGQCMEEETTSMLGIGLTLTRIGRQVYSENVMERVDLELETMGCRMSLLVLLMWDYWHLTPDKT